MAGIIAATVSGYVAQDPELKEIGQNTVANFSIPVSEKVKGEERTTWVRVAVWGSRARVIGDYVKKGSYLTVTGRLGTREYEKDGQTRTSIELNASDFAFGPGRQDAETKQETKDNDPF